MPRAKNGWDPGVTRRLAAEVLRLLPASGAWVDLPWILARTRRLIDIAHADANYRRHGGRHGGRPWDQVPMDLRCQLGREWLVGDAMTTHRRNGKVESDGRGDRRRYPHRHATARPPPAVESDG